MSTCFSITYPESLIKLTSGNKKLSFAENPSEDTKWKWKPNVIHHRMPVPGGGYHGQQQQTCFDRMKMGFIMGFSIG